MRNISINLSILFLIAIFSGCNNLSYQYVDPITIKIQDNDSMYESGVLLSSVIGEIAYVPLETSGLSSINEPHKIIFHNGKYFILDKYVASAVVSFDSMGNFVTKYGSRGTGRGEYVLPMDFLIDEVNQELLILNSEKHSILYFDLHSGNYKRFKTYRFPTHAFIKLEKNVYVFKGASRDSRIIFTDSNFNITTKAIKYQHRYGVGIFNPLVKQNDTFSIFRMSYNDTIYRVYNDRIMPYVILDFQSKRLTDEFYGSLTTGQQMRLNEYTMEKMCDLINYIESNEVRYFSFLFNQKVYLVTQNKQNGQIRFLNSSQIVDDLFGVGGFPLILGVDKEGYFLSLYSSSKLLNPNTMQNTPKGYRRTKELEKITSGLNSLSNPVLIKFKIK